MFNIDNVVRISAVRCGRREAGNHNPMLEPSDNELLKYRSYWGDQQAETEDVCENSRCEEHGTSDEDHEPIYEGVTWQLSPRQLRLDATKALDSLALGKPRPDKTGHDDQAQSE